jgi:hypothetical protein
MSPRSLRYRDVPVLWRANPGALRAYVIVSSATCAEGLAMVLGGEGRTASDSYATIHELGGPKAYGVAMLVVVTLLIAGPLYSLRLTYASLLTGCAMHMTMSISFVTSALHSPTAGLLGTIVMSAVAVWFASQAVLYRIVRR